MSQLNKRNWAYRIWIFFLGIPIIMGVYAAAVRFTTPQEIYGTTQLVPLGILISTYIFFVITGTGLCIIASLGHVFRIRRFELIGRRAIFLAIITLLCGFGAIGLELEWPLRLMAYNFTSPQFSAPIWWMGVFYTLCLPFLLLEFGFLLRENSKKARVFGIGAFLTEIIAACTLGIIFGVIVARPYWYGIYIPVYLILSGMSSGAAFIICFTAITYRIEKNEMPSSLREVLRELGKILAVFVGITLIMMGLKIIMSLQSRPSPEYKAAMALLRGPLSLNFWLFEVLLGSLIPLLILTIPRARIGSGIVVAAICVISGMFVSRYNMVIAGQIYPVWGGDYAIYSPNHIEWFIVIACIGTCLLLYTVGSRFLPLNEESREN